MDFWDDDYVELNEDDLAARRVLALGILLINARRPLSSGEIKADLYADMSDDTFRRTFLRDREKLMVAGLVLKQAAPAPARGTDALWEVDGDASFVRNNLLTQEDALLLDLLLLPLASDPAFPYARDLRLALTKIDRSFDGSHIVRIPPESRRRDTNLARIEDCLTAHRTAHMRYLRADGVEVDRVVAPLGLFCLNANTYMVAARADDAGPAGEPPHTYNLARVRSIREQKRTFAPPDDFDVRDFIKLPFQLGETRYTACFIDDNTGALRTEDVYDTGIAAAWALAHGLRPTEPSELVEAWESSVADARRRLLPTAPKEGTRVTEEDGRES